MWFWIFMLVMDLLIPLLMIGFGKYFMKNTPKEINALFGYRTTMSMKNKATWEFAHQCSGKLWYKIGLLLLLVTVIAMLFVIGKDIDTVANWGMAICFLQVIPLVGSIFPVERALKKHFDKNGNPL